MGRAMKHAKDYTKPILPTFTVTIADSSYTTSAYTSHAAISKVAYRYGRDNGIAVGLVQFKIKNGELRVTVEEVKGGKG
jgi:hypothetical protein